MCWSDVVDVPNMLRRCAKHQRVAEVSRERCLRRGRFDSDAFGHVSELPDAWMQPLNIATRLWGTANGKVFDMLPSTFLLLCLGMRVLTVG